MFGVLSSGKSWPIGLDIGAESIKMLQLCQTGSRVRVRAGARWRFPQSVDDPAQRKEMAVGAIREMLKCGGFGGRKVVSALSCSQLSIKNIRLPQMPPKELLQAVQWEASERFSFDVTPDRLNYLNAGQVRQGTETRDEIIMFAAAEGVIEEHLDIIRRSKLIPEAIDVRAIALFRIFERFLRRRADEQAVSVIVDIGYSGTRVVVARGRRVVFIKEIDIGGKRLSDAVAGQLDLSFDEARELRMRNTREDQGSSDGGQVDRSSLEWTIHDAVRGEVEALAREISLCLRYCSVTFRGLRPQEILLTGGEIYDGTLVSLLNDQLSVPCVVGQPLKDVDTSAADLGADRRATVTEWALCAGLAIRGMNMQNNIQENNDEQRRLSA